jgi:hypothetical protein
MVAATASGVFATVKVKEKPICGYCLILELLSPCSTWAAQARWWSLIQLIKGEKNEA